MSIGLAGYGTGNRTDHLFRKISVSCVQHIPRVALRRSIRLSQNGEAKTLQTSVPSASLYFILLSVIHLTVVQVTVRLGCDRLRTVNTHLASEAVISVLARTLGDRDIAVVDMNLERMQTERVQLERNGRSLHGMVVCF